MNQQRDRSAWLSGGDATCCQTGDKPARPYRMVLLGAPGIGKGTQAELICERLGTCHLSTGDVFRAAKCAEGELSPAMASALEYMKRGDLVPDDTVIDMVRERVHCMNCDLGFLLDGYPRTVAQAESLKALLGEINVGLDAVLSYELPVDKVVARISGRRICGACGRSYHVETLPPKMEGACDSCVGEHLYQREDDKPESIRVRLKAYEDSTAPLKDYYAQQGLLVEIDADGTPQQVFDRTVAALDAKT